PCAVGEHPRRRARPGRLDEHPAARPQPLHRARADGEAEAEGSLPRDQAEPEVAETADPDDVPEPGLLRQPRLRRGSGGPDVLLATRPVADPAAGGAARRADQGTLRIRPLRRPRAGAAPASAGARRHARPGPDHPGAVRLGGQAEAGPETRAPVHADPRAVLLRVRA